MVDKNDALFREVEEELRREQYAKLWQRYGTYFIALAVAVVLAVAGAKLWESRRAAAANAAGAEYEAAAALLSSAKTEDALKAFEAISSTGPKGYGELASLAQAGAYLKLDMRQEALALFDKLAENPADPSLASFARLQGASLRLGEADFTEMQNRLKPLTADDNPWRFSAGELLGMAAIKAGKLDEARTILKPLIEAPGLTEGAAARLHRLMSEIATGELSGSASTPSTTPASTTPAPAAGSAPAQSEEKPAPAP